MGALQSRHMDRMVRFGKCTSRCPIGYAAEYRKQVGQMKITEQNETPKVEQEDDISLDCRGKRISTLRGVLIKNMWIVAVAASLPDAS